MRPPPERKNWLPSMPLIVCMGYVIARGSDPANPWTLMEVIFVAIGFHLFDQLIRRLAGPSD